MLSLFIPIGINRDPNTAINMVQQLSSRSQELGQPTYYPQLTQHGSLIDLTPPTTPPPEHHGMNGITPQADHTPAISEVRYGPATASQGQEQADQISTPRAPSAASMAIREI